MIAAPLITMPPAISPFSLVPAAGLAISFDVRSDITSLFLASAAEAL
jgi:hypothetical protein